MKKIITTLFLIVLYHISFSQSKNDKIFYLDTLYTKTEEKKEYFRYITVKDFTYTKKFYEVTIHHLNGVIESKGYSKSKDIIIKIGEYTNYHENKKIKSICFFEDGMPKGRCTLFYENGDIKMEGEYSITLSKDQEKICKLKIENAWNKDKIKTVNEGQGYYEDDENYSQETKNFLNYSISSGQITNGYKEGEWKGNNIELKYSFTEIYKNGELISGESIDKNNQKINYTKLQENAEPEEGMSGLYKFIGKNFKIPDINNLKGKILISFKVSEKGNIESPKIIHSYNDDIDKEGIRVIKNYKKKWEASKIRGIPLTVTFTLPITFQTP